MAEKACMHISNNQGESAVSTTNSPVVNNAVHTVCNENMYLVPEAFKMN